MTHSFLTGTVLQLRITQKTPKSFFRLSKFHLSNHRLSVGFFKICFHLTASSYVDRRVPRQHLFGFQLWIQVRGTHLGEDHLPGMFFACSLCFCRLCAWGMQVDSWKRNAVPPLQALFHNQGCEATLCDDSTASGEQSAGSDMWARWYVRWICLVFAEDFCHPWAAKNIKWQMINYEQILNIAEPWENHAVY